MAKRKFDESKVKRDKGGRFARSAGVEVAGKPHPIPTTRRLTKAERARLGGNPNMQGNAYRGAGTAPQRRTSGNAAGEIKTSLKRQKQNRKITGYGFTNVR